VGVKWKGLGVKGFVQIEFLFLKSDPYSLMALSAFGPILLWIIFNFFMLENYEAVTESTSIVFGTFRFIELKLKESGF
jgi:hypothetical protein